MTLEQILKDASQTVTILSINTRNRAQAHKYLVVDGVVHYDEERLTPQETLDKFVTEWEFVFDVLSCSVITRVEDTTIAKGYRWSLNEIII